METTEILRRAAAGEAGAEAELFDACYADLRARAGLLMRHQAPQTLQPTALVNEAWLKLSLPEASWEDRRHFLRAATRAMRCVLVDHARARRADKRGGGAMGREVVPEDAAADEPSWRILALDEALDELAEKDATAFEVAQLRIFAGLAHADIADAMGVTERSVERYWARAREALQSAL